jgi:hypothetical protein
MSRRLIPLLIAIILLASATLACGLGPRAKELLGMEDSSNQPLPTESSEIFPLPGETEQESDPAGEEQAPETQESPGTAPENADLIKGLDALDSYQLNMTIKTYEKDSEGTTIEKATTITKEVDAVAGDEHTLMVTSDSSESSSSDSGEALSNIETYTIEGTTYHLFPGEDGTVSCMSSPSDESPSEDYTASMSQVFGSMVNLKLVKEGEMVNGVKTNHYTFDEKNLKNAKLTKAAGDVWVAQDGGFVVKITAKGAGPALLENDEDKIVEYDIMYSVEDINQAITITAPDSCQQGLPDELPVPASATVEVSMEGFYSLKSTESSDLVAEFYRAALPERGWEITSDSSLETMFTFEFNKAGKAYTMMITSSDTGCDILIAGE